MDVFREVQKLIPAWQLDLQLLYVPYAALITLAVCFWAAAVLASPTRRQPGYRSVCPAPARRQAPGPPAPVTVSAAACPAGRQAAAHGRQETARGT